LTVKIADRIPFQDPRNGKPPETVGRKVTGLKPGISQ
jgi:hypothetical protein